MAMKTETLPIGSLVLINNVKAIIVGYFWGEQGQHLVRQYAVLPYPQGYTDKSSLKIVSDNMIQVVNEGYKSEASKHLLRYLDNVNQMASQVPAKKMYEYLDRAIRETGGK